MHSTESRFVKGPSDILFAGVCVCVCACVCVCVCVCALFQPGNFTGWGSEGVNFVVIVLSIQASSSVFVL